MRTRISSKGQVVLPADLRRQDDIAPGQEFEIERVAAGEYRLLRRPPRADRRLVDWLLACPEKGFFVPVASESTGCM
jgi:AbrB family looped-hinge helix DNA binding protein